MKNKTLSLLTLLLTVTSVAATVSFASTPKTSTYGIHLFFDEKEFVDVLTLTTLENGLVEGMMHVPDDFDGKIENVLSFGGGLAFDLVVPKNRSRPTDQIFHYRMLGFDASLKQLTGFVTIKGKNEFVASLVGFRREVH